MTGRHVMLGDHFESNGRHIRVETAQLGRASAGTDYHGLHKETAKFMVRDLTRDRSHDLKERLSRLMASTNHLQIIIRNDQADGSRLLHSISVKFRKDGAKNRVDASYDKSQFTKAEPDIGVKAPSCDGSCLAPTEDRARHAAVDFAVSKAIDALFGPDRPKRGIAAPRYGLVRRHVD